MKFNRFALLLALSALIVLAGCNLPIAGKATETGRSTFGEVLVKVPPGTAPEQREAACEAEEKRISEENDTTACKRNAELNCKDTATEYCKPDNYELTMAVCNPHNTQVHVECTYDCVCTPIGTPPSSGSQGPTGPSTPSGGGAPVSGGNAPTGPNTSGNPNAGCAFSPADKQKILNEGAEKGKGAKALKGVQICNTHTCATAGKQCAYSLASGFDDPGKCECGGAGGSLPSSGGPGPTGPITEGGEEPSPGGVGPQGPTTGLPTERQPADEEPLGAAK